MGQFTVRYSLPASGNKLYNNGNAGGWSLPQPLPLSLLDQGVGDVTGLYVC